MASQTAWPPKVINITGGEWERLAVVPIREVEKSFECRGIDPLTKYKCDDIVVAGYTVKANTAKLRTFRADGTQCRICGMSATFYAIEREDQNEKCTLNLYGIDDRGVEISFNSDHIVPKSVGGKNALYNRQTTCQVCNLAKGNLTKRGQIAYTELLREAKEHKVREAMSKVKSISPANADKASKLEKEIVKSNADVQIQTNSQSSNLPCTKGQRSGRGRVFWVH